MPNSVINNIVIKGLCAAVPENKIFLMDKNFRSLGRSLLKVMNIRQIKVLETYFL